MFVMTNVSDTTIWNTLMRVRTEKEHFCSGEGPFIGSKEVLNEIVPAVHGYLNISQLDTTVKNLTNIQLKKAGDMFWYLISCYEPIKQWIFFYTKIFQNKPSYENVLALNRILKDRTNTQNLNLKLIARKLLKRTESLLALHFPKIQRKINGYEKDYYISIKGNNQGTNWQLKIFDLIQI